MRQGSRLQWLSMVLGMLCASSSSFAQPDWAGHPVNRWVLQSPRDGQPAPNFPYEGSGSYDPHSRLWIHHGGHDGIPQGFHTFTFDLDTGEWKQRFPPTSPPGACCVDGAGAYDAANRRFVRFPGGSLGHGYQWSRGVKLKDSAVWLYDPSANVWTNMRPPPYQAPEKYSRDVVGGLCSGAVYDPLHEIVLSFGGQSSGGGKNALFAYDAYSNLFQRLPAENPPPERDGMGIAYDSRENKLVVFGSQYLADERTWLFDLRTNRWTAHDLNPHPPAQKVTEHYTTIPRLAYDSLHGVVLCVAWLGEDRHESWALDAGKLSWRKLEPSLEPAGSKSRSRNLSFDAERNVFILETSSAKTNRPEIWTYRYAERPRDPGPASPEGLEAVTLGGSKAALSWKPSVTSGLKEHRVYRAQSSELARADFSQVGATSSARFEDAGLEAGKVYFYRVTSVAEDGRESPQSQSARTQPGVLLKPVVSVLGPSQAQVVWSRHPASDVTGYNLYRGLVKVRTVKKGTPGAWQDNDPDYAEPLVVEVLDITSMEKRNDRPLEEADFTDAVDLTRTSPEAGDYKHAVYAYVVRAVNRLGVESGPSPYALTIPSEPVNLFCREEGEVAELKWDPSPENRVAGYHVYKLEGTWSIIRITPEPIRETRFRHRAGQGPTRYWVVAVDALGQEGQPSSPAWFGQAHRGFFTGEWHQ